MKKLLKITGYLVGGIFALFVLAYIFFIVKRKIESHRIMALLSNNVAILQEQGISYRDLNKNGRLDVYEDRRASTDARIEDLLEQMTLEEKAGSMFITMTPMLSDGTLCEIPTITDPLTLAFKSNSYMVVKKLMTHFNIFQSPSAIGMATWHNQIQRLAERTRLGIPITIASDPRHGATDKLGASIPTPFFSKWCNPLGFAAIGDTLLMKEFADIARQEYTAVGIRLALSPMADLATEPRWGRIDGTFGEDAEISAALVKAYIQGFQRDSLTSSSVACMTKHFSGGGPQKNGEDAHFAYGAEQVYPGNNFNYHLIPFEKGAFKANTAQIMPYYGIPVGQTDEDVAFSFNRHIITQLLREEYGFDGVICTDWGLITDSFFKPASAWGVEELTEIERVQKVLDAGCDMFGGEMVPEMVVKLVETGKIKEERLNVSLRRIMRDKFKLGLFDNPYLDLDKVSIVGSEQFMKKGREAQRKSLTLLKNENGILPLQRDQKIYFQGFESSVTAGYDQSIGSPEEADVIIMKLSTPFEPRDNSILERYFHQGRLYFTDQEKSKILPLMKQKPTITVFSMERPPVIPDINKETKALIAEFDCQDDIILSLIFGEFKPTGKLPFEIPASIEAVNNQKEDVPYDSPKPLYPFGYGISF